MVFADKLLTMFIVHKDEDIAADNVFRRGFFNVVNFFMLAYTILLACHALLWENTPVAIINFVSGAMFVGYFVLDMIMRDKDRLTTINKFVLLFYFSIAMCNGAVTKFPTTVVVMYPFIAVVLHGRRLGIILSLTQSIFVAAFTLILQELIPSLNINYTKADMIIVFCQQIASLCTFLYVLRWLSSMIYDKIHDVMSLTEDLKTSHEFINVTTDQLSEPLKNILTNITRLQQGNLNSKQIEFAQNIYISALNAQDRLHEIQQGAKHNVVLPPENNIEKFSIQQLLTSIMINYSSSAHRVEKNHTISISDEVPQIVTGNQQLTRMCMMKIFDGINRRQHIKNLPVNIHVTVCDMQLNHIILNYTIQIETQLVIDHRDMGTSEEMLISNLDLHNARRLIDATESNFLITYINNTLTIEFTQKCSVNNQSSLSTEEANMSRVLINKSKSLSELNILAISVNPEIDQAIRNVLEQKVERIAFSPDHTEALNIFENNYFNVCLIFLDYDYRSEYNKNVHNYIRHIRDIEVGIGKSTVVIAMHEREITEEVRSYAIDDGIYKFILIPNDIDKLPSLIAEMTN